MGNGSSKHGDAIGDKLRDRFARNRAERRRARERLESLPDDDVTETQIIVQGGHVHVGETGRHRAMTDDTKSENDKPSDPPPRKFALAVLDRIQPPWLRAVVVLAALAIVGLLAWRGVALTGLLP